MAVSESGNGVHSLTRRGFLGLAGGGVMAAGLAACGGGGGSAGGGAGSNSGKVTVWGWKDTIASLQKSVPGFTKKYPKITIDGQNVGIPAIYDKMTTALAAGGQGLPDIATVLHNYVPVYLDKFADQFADQSKFGIAKHKSEFSAALWEPVTKGSAIYGFPWWTGGLLLYYRNDMFGKIGVNVADLKSWPEVIDAAKKLKAKTGAKLLSMDMSAASKDTVIFDNLLKIQRLFYFDSAGNISLTDPKVVATLALLKQMNDAGLIEDATGTLFQAAVRNNKVAAQFDSDNFHRVLMQTQPEQSGKWRAMLPPPVTVGGTREAGGDCVYQMISANSKNTQAAYTFTEYSMTDPSAVLAIYGRLGLIPAYHGVWDNPALTGPLPYFGGQPVIKILLDTLKTGKAFSPNYTTDYQRALKLVIDAEMKVLTHGADPGQALAQAAKQLASQTGRKIVSGS